MKTSTILKKAKRKISKPERWNKGEYAVDADGNVVLARSADAVCWCMQGALMAATRESVGDLEWLVANRALSDALPTKNGFSVEDYNDAPRRTHAQIMRLFDRAIERAEKEEGKR